jgi:hypothetical protein
MDIPGVVLYNLPFGALLRASDTEVPPPVHITMIIGFLNELQLFMLGILMHSSKLMVLQTFTFLLPSCVSGQRKKEQLLKE